MKAKFLAVCACALIPSSALGQAANDRSPLWICKSSEGYSCQEKKGCAFIPAELLKTVDFDRMIVKDVGQSFETKITNIRYFTSQFSPAATYLSVGMSQSFVILAEPREELGSPNIFPMRIVNASADRGQNVYFGTCSPA